MNVFLYYIFDYCIYFFTFTDKLASGDYYHTGDSFRDLTRIAKINEELWCQLFMSNRDLLTAEIEQFEAALTDLKERLAAGDEEGLKELFRRSTQRRKLFDRPQN